MRRIGECITLEEEAARRFFWDAFHPDPKEVARREELERKFDSKSRVIKRNASETVFEIDDDLFDMDVVFGRAALKSSPVAMARHVRDTHSLSIMLVDLDSLCKELSIQVLPFDLDSLSKSVRRHIHACISVQPVAQACILVRDDDKHQDVRFAIALALGTISLVISKSKKAELLSAFRRMRL